MNLENLEKGILNMIEVKDCFFFDIRESESTRNFTDKEIDQALNNLLYHRNIRLSIKGNSLLYKFNKRKD